MASNKIPEAWGKEVTVLTGVDLVDKESLINKPFLITKLQFRPGTDQNISYVWVTALDVNGDAFQFNDSSTGIREQLILWLSDNGNEGVVDTTDEFSTSLAVLNGLRKSTYDKTVGSRTIKATTYYLRYTTED